MRSILLALALLACSTAALAQKPPAACKLISPAELTAVLGIQVGPGKESDVVVQQGTFKGQTTTFCAWPVPQGTVSLSIIRVATPAQRVAGLAEMQKNNRDLQASLKQQGWRTEETNVGGLRCLTAIPSPALAARKTPTGTSCSADVTRGLALSIGTNLLGTRLPPAKLKAFYDAAVKHLP